MSFAKNRSQNRLQCTFTDNMQKTVTLMIYAEGELFAKTDISAAKKSGPYQKFAVKFMRFAFTLYRKCVIIISKFKLTRIARYRKDGNLYEINICNRK